MWRLSQALIIVMYLQLTFGEGLRSDGLKASISTKNSTIGTTTTRSNFSSSTSFSFTTSSSLSNTSIYANAMDRCWRFNPQWANQRVNLAKCALGFGSNAMGGMFGRIYVVTNPSDDNVIYPSPGTLRHALSLPIPLWITFEKNMLIIPKRELLVSSYKTIDGRGVNVQIAFGPCITIENVNNVIIHGINVHHCFRGPARWLRFTEGLVHRGPSDGDAISIMGSKHVRIDHNSLSMSTDGLVDVTLGSSFVTISNNLFTNHDKVMLLGHSDNYPNDIFMRVTISYNRFGPGCVQRMPRCRFGYFHIVNNDYLDWQMYAIGGSAAPTIRSEGNRYTAKVKMEVTKREPYRGHYKGWGVMLDPATWQWISIRDEFVNGAYFIQSGLGELQTIMMPSYNVSQALETAGPEKVPMLTRDAGSLFCKLGLSC